MNIDAELEGLKQDVLRWWEDSTVQSEAMDELIDFCFAASRYETTQEYNEYMSDYLRKIEEEMNPISLEDHQVKAGMAIAAAKCVNLLDNRNIDEILEDAQER